MADEKKKIAPGYFTVEEANLICIYNKKDRQVVERRALSFPSDELFSRQ